MIHLLGERARSPHVLPEHLRADERGRPVYDVRATRELLARPLLPPRRMAHPPNPPFQVGDHVSWNSEAGRVRGVIKKKLTKPTKLEGYTARASKEEPQYVIESDKTDHIAVHKGSALRKLRSSAPKRPKSSG